MSTPHPADCKRAEVYTGECRNFADTEWIPFESARRRSPAARDGNTWLVDCGIGSFWKPDDKVRGLVRLVPAREVTRDDLPSESSMRDAYARARYGDSAFGVTLDAVVEHLNERGGVPDEMAKHERAEIFRITGRQYQELREELDEAVDESRALRDDRDHWRQQAHSNAVERDDWKRSATEWEESHADAVRDRNAWKGRAESDGAALKRERAERDEWREQAGRNGTERDEAREAHTRVSRMNERLADENDYLTALAAPAVTYVEVEYAINGAGTPGDPRWLSRATDAVWQLVSGEQPAVTRNEIETAVWGGLMEWGTTDKGVSEIADAICAIVSGADPAVIVVRESDLPGASPTGGGGWEVSSSEYALHGGSPERLRFHVRNHLRQATECEAVARAIEAEQALLDQVEEQADSLADILYGDELVTDQMRGVLERVVRAGMKLPEDDR